MLISIDITTQKGESLCPITCSWCKKGIEVSGIIYHIGLDVNGKTWAERIVHEQCMESVIQAIKEELIKLGYEIRKESFSMDWLKENSEEGQAYAEEIQVEIRKQLKCDNETAERIVKGLVLAAARAPSDIRTVCNAFILSLMQSNKDFTG